MTEQGQMTLQDMVKGGASSGLFFAYAFLPESYTLEPGEYHHDFFDILDNTENQYISVAVYRDGGKTTLARTTILRRICYAISRTILIVSETKPHSIRTIDWIRRKVKRANSPLVQAFGLSIGSTDSKEELIIRNQAYGTETTLLAQGITGQVRGVNIDDARPDCILIDDAGSDENMATEIQRKKTTDIYFGAVENSLAARSINPHAQIINITTRHHEDDIHGLCEIDPRYKTFSLGVFNEKGESTWPAKFTTEQLYRDKAAYIARRQLAVWMREKENKIVRSESQPLAEEWLHLEMHDAPDREAFSYVLGFDPSAPASDAALARGLKNKDFAVFTVLALRAGKVWIVRQVATLEPDPLWERTTFLELYNTFRPLAMGVEAVAYQRTSARALGEVCHANRIYLPIVEITDRRKKVTRILDELSPLAYSGGLTVDPRCSQFLTAYSTFPGCDYFDHLDSVIMGILAAKEYAGGMLLPIAGPAGAVKPLSLEAQLAAERKEFGALDEVEFEGYCP